MPARRVQGLEARRLPYGVNLSTAGTVILTDAVA